MCGLCVQLVAVLREVKYLLIRNMEEIPASASQLYANNDTLLMYVAHLDLTVAWYNKIRETVLEVEYPIIEAQLTAIDAQLRQAEETLDWQTDGKIFLSLFLSVSVYLSVGHNRVKGKGSPYSITERRVPELIPVLGSQPAGDVSHKPGGRLPLLSAKPAVTPATLKMAATNFAAW